MRLVKMAQSDAFVNYGLKLKCALWEKAIEIRVDAFVMQLSGEM